MDLPPFNNPPTVALPDSSPPIRPTEPSPRTGISLSTDPHDVSPTLLRKTPSSNSLASTRRSLTPTLHNKKSLSSLQGAGGLTPSRSPAVRRISSSILSSPTSGAPFKPTAQPLVQHPASSPVVTAASFARDYFLKEIESHNTPDDLAVEPETVVLLHDACYGHRFSRPRTSKAILNTIVERPERIHATILGLAAAYVRLGGSHAGGTNAPHLQRIPSKTDSVPFKIKKSSRAVSLLSQAVINIHGTKWMEDLRSMCTAAEARLALNGKELVRPAVLVPEEDEVQSALHEGDLYLCSESLNALEGALGGVCEAVDEVFSKFGPKRAFVCVRPPGHHCSSSYPSGFCWLNNVHVGISHASITHGLTHAAIIDFDLHHGDGSQSITWSHNAKIAGLPKNAPASKKMAIGYFSLHDINSYPCEWGDEEKVRNASLCLENAHGQTIWNVHLQPWKTESEFWQLYQDRYLTLIIKARSFLRLHSEKIRSLSNHSRPKAAIFISAGFDASEWESPGMQRHKVNVPTDFYARFTQDIMRLANEEGLGVEGRVISVLEGGYSDRALTSGILSHMCGLTAKVRSGDAISVHDRPSQGIERRLGNLEINGTSAGEKHVSHNNLIVPLDSRWWELPRLEELENLVNPPSQATAPKKSRSGLAATYNTPTQSYAAKIITPPPNRRSFSASSSAVIRRPSSNTSSRAPTSPPLDVDWATAAHELCKLLIPSDRQTRSCRPEELNAEASRARRDRQSIVGLQPEKQPTNGQRMQLRERKSKTPKDKVDDEESRVVSRSNGRKTFTGAADFNEEHDDQQGLPIQTKLDSNSDKIGVRPGRRLSTASSTMTTSDDRSVVSSTNGFRHPSSNGIPPLTSHSSSSTSSVQAGSAVNNCQQPPVTKKTQAPSTSRTNITNPKSRVSTNLPPIPRVPSLYTKTSDTKVLKSSIQGQEVNQTVPYSGGNDIMNENVDQLSRGLHKMSIKLNVPPILDVEINERKKKPLGRPPRKSIGGKPTKTVEAPVFDPPAKQIAPELKLSSASKFSSAPETKKATNPAPVDLEMQTSNRILSNLDPVSSSTSKAAQIPPPPSFKSPTPPTIPAIVSEPQSSLPNSSLFVNEDKGNQLQKSTQPVEHASTASLSPVLVKPITPKKTKQDLPIFTSTSPIIFAQPSGQGENVDQMITAKSHIGSDDRLATGERRGDGLGPSPPRFGTGDDQYTTASSTLDVWGVPDTPQRPSS